MVACMKKEVAIWNINSFGEFYMQIEEKYKKDYEVSLVKLKGERRKLADALAGIEGLRVIPSQANYIMVEITHGMTSKEVTKRMLLKYNIFIKDLTKKIQMGEKQFVRIAVRNSEDNARLVNAFKEVLE